MDVDRNNAEFGSQMDQANQNQKFFDSEIQKLNQDSMTNLGNTDEAKETNYQSISKGVIDINKDLS